MGLRINQNIDALNSYRNLSVTQGQMSKSLEKLSSGFRINRAADDAAGLAISEGLRSQVGGLKVAVRNAQDGVSVVQTAEGALTETHSILQRMRDLAVQASNDGGLNADAKGNIQSEMSQLKDELTRIADTTQFNGTKLLDGAYNGTFQVGANAGETIAVAVGTAMSAAGLGVSDVDVTTGAATWKDDAGTIDFAGAAAPAAGTLIFGGQTYTVDAAALGTWDTAGTSAAASKNQALMQKAYDSALSGSPLSAKVDSFGGVTISGPAKVSGAATVTGDLTGTLVPANFALASSGGAETAISTIDTAIKTVSTVRADLGAVQNRFDHTINNLNVAVENLSASESRIRDTDMASEMMNFTRSQILSQAGTAMLAQANQASQGVLQLLR
jgi:flagellin